MPAEDTLPGRFTAFDAAALDRIEAAADRVLAETGLRFEDDPDTLALWRQAGAEVDGDRVRLDGPRLRQIIRATAPAHFVLHGRNPAAAPGSGPASARSSRRSTARRTYCGRTAAAASAPAPTITG